MLVGEAQLGGHFMWFSRGCKITTEVEGQRAVLSVEGEVTIGIGDVKLREAICILLDQEVRDIVIDLEDVTTLDSSGMAELVAAYKNVKDRGGTLELRGLSAHIPDFPDFPNFPNFPDGFAY
jgi:anti-sigma B factor antagonist